jgi:PleD family two-component response regulator
LVLIANDQEWSARSIESVLAPQGYGIVRAFTGQQAIDTARASRPALIILDAQLPDIHGFDVCRTLRADPAVGPSVPVIITTAGPAGRPQRLEAARAGAWDFQGQPLDAELLVARAEAFLASTEEARRRTGDALVDLPTGLLSLAGLTERLRQISAQAVRLRIPLACVVLTPENLRGTGMAEDAVLIELGNALRRLSRESDVVGRLSADEFIVVAPATDRADAELLATRLRDALAPELAGRGVALKTSVVALDERETRAAIDEDELLRRVAARWS